MKRIRLKDYLDHIENAVTRIERFTSGLDARGFENDELIQSGVIHQLQIIGEASRKILEEHPDFASQHPDMSLRQASRMRNRLIHGYFDVDLDVVWSVVENELDRLKDATENAKRQLDVDDCSPSDGPSRI